jgi:hypothetical protein
MSFAASSSLIVKRVPEPLICLSHLSQFPELTANMPFEPRIVVNAGRLIIFLAKQFLEVPGE